MSKHPNSSKSDYHDYCDRCGQQLIECQPYFKTLPFPNELSSSTYKCEFYFEFPDFKPDRLTQDTRITLKMELYKLNMMPSGSVYTRPLGKFTAMRYTFCLSHMIRLESQEGAFYHMTLEKDIVDNLLEKYKQLRLKSDKQGSYLEMEW